MEVLVSTAVIGILATLSSVILINKIRSANKANITNEAKENLSLVAELLTRDVRESKSVTLNSSTSLQLNYSDGSIVNWTCTAPGAGANGYVSRNAVTVTNKDPQEGVSYSNCLFLLSGSAGSQIVTLNLTLTEGAGTAGRPQDLGVTVSQQITAFVRNY